MAITLSRRIRDTVALTLTCHLFSLRHEISYNVAFESLEPPFKNRNSKEAYQASNIQANSKGSDRSVRMRRLVLAFAYRIYHIVGNLMLWLIYGPH